MKIGKYELHKIETGVFGLDGGAMFGIVPRSLWCKLNTPDEENRIELALRALLIMGDNRNILVDTGVGSKLTEKQKKIYRIDQEKDNLDASLKRFNLETKDITDVILTHLHFDHAGGATSIEEGEHTLTFPNATYYVQKANYEWALNPSDKDRGSYLLENFVPVAERGRLETLGGEGEIFTQIEVMVSNGHTTGMQLVKVSDGTQTLVYCSDLIPTVHHVRIPYIASYDNHPLKTIDEKKKLLEMAGANGWTLFLVHDAESEAVKVEKTEFGFTVREKIFL